MCRGSTPGNLSRLSLPTLSSRVPTNPLSWDTWTLTHAPLSNLRMIRYRGRGKRGETRAHEGVREGRDGVDVRDNMEGGEEGMKGHCGLQKERIEEREGRRRG